MPATSGASLWRMKCMTRLSNEGYGYQQEHEQKRSPEMHGNSDCRSSDCNYPSCSKSRNSQTSKNQETRLLSRDSSFSSRQQATAFTSPGNWAATRLNCAVSHRKSTMRIPSMKRKKSGLSARCIASYRRQLSRTLSPVPLSRPIISSPSALMVRIVPSFLSLLTSLPKSMGCR